jgi:hypothetical protein
MTLGLPQELDAAFARADTVALVTVDGRGHPVAATRPVSHDAGAGCFDLAAAVGLPDPRVALVLGGGTPDLVLVQGTARPVGSMGLRVRPERIYRWADRDLDSEPQLFDAHLEEVRSAHNEEPEVGHEPPAAPQQVPTSWDERLDALSALESATGTLAVVGPDGFPFGVLAPVEVDPSQRRVRLRTDPVGAPLDPGPACVLVLDEERRDLLVSGDLLEEDGRWVLRPHELH